LPCSTWAPRTVSATRSASRVLPMPPGPTSVSRRQSGSPTSRPRISATSTSRPMKRVRGVGRLCRGTVRSGAGPPGARRPSAPAGAILGRAGEPRKDGSDVSRCRRPYFSIRARRVLREMPRAAALRRMLPPVSRRATSMRARSASSRDPTTAEAAVWEKSIITAVISPVPVPDSSTTRSIVLANSRTLPGQLCAASFARASALSVRGASPYSVLACARKCSARATMLLSWPSRRFRGDRRAAHDGAVGAPGPVVAKPSPLPAQDGVRGDDDQRLLPASPQPGQRPKRAGRHGATSGGPPPSCAR
jgi:hypothetical protein